MNPTQQSLLEQMRFTDVEIAARKDLLGFGDADLQALSACRDQIGKYVDEIVDAFYAQQTSVPEIAALIGDADTMHRLETAQHRYIADLFGGVYDREYVNNRLRIGLVHKRIGVEPKLYLSAVHVLRGLIRDKLAEVIDEPGDERRISRALDKLLFFDVTLVFETYLQSMLSEIEAARRKSEQYARALEATVQANAGQLRTDPLTGLTTRRFLDDGLQRALRAASRRAEPLTLVFIDIDGFKAINDGAGHARGDEVLRQMGKILQKAGRGDDICARYGGDEFCAVLVNCTEDQARTRFCRRVLDMMHERLPMVRASMGIAQTGPDSYDEPLDLMARADTLMYREKALRKGADAPDSRRHLKPVGGAS